jgi:two-component system, NtrC family, nitrogen regulation sensor histidine kinase NtrY
MPINLLLNSISYFPIFNTPQYFALKFIIYHSSFIIKFMTLKLKFIVFITVIHSVAIGLSFLILKDNKLYFIASELLVLVSLIISWSLFNDLIQPLQRLMTGVNAIKDQDFTVKFIKTNEVETDSLINVYNAMIDQLRTEKTQQEAQHYFLEKLVTTSPTGILILDFDNKVADLNPKCAEIMNLTKQELIGQSIYVFDNYLLKTIADLETGASKTIHLNSAKTFKCAKAHFIDRGFPRYFIMIEELTAEILAAEKKAYGKVIRMMAHEVNNSIGAVNSILDTTIQLNEASKETNDALQIAFDRNEHLSTFMRNFADVIRLPLLNLTLLNINELVLKTAQFMAFKAAEKNIVFQLALSGVNGGLIKLQIINSELSVIKNELNDAQLINSELGTNKNELNDAQLINSELSISKNELNDAQLINSELSINKNELNDAQLNNSKLSINKNELNDAQLNNSELGINKNELNTNTLKSEIWNLKLDVKADFNQMEQVLINVIKNAMEAIGENGVVTFRTTAKPLQLFIEDTGCGIPKTVENQLFTPFFTTKPYGQGVGLTLIREVLTAHNFDFALYTEGPNDELHTLNSKENSKSKTVFKIQF